MCFQLCTTGLLGRLLSVYMCLDMSTPEGTEVRQLSFMLATLSPFISNPGAGENISWVALSPLFLHWPVKPSDLAAVLIIVKVVFSQQHGLKTWTPAQDTIQQSLPTTDLHPSEWHRWDSTAKVPASKNNSNVSRHENCSWEQVREYVPTHSQTWMG